jgi:nickel/cobalt transporter (NicO) family protein
VGTTSVALLILAAATVAILHSILPDHWVPLAVVARAERWGIGRVARLSALASAGHVLTSVVLGGVIAVVGLQFQRQIDVQQGHLVGAVLIITGVAFLVWGLTGHGHSHHHAEHTHGDAEAHEHDDGEHSHDDDAVPSHIDPTTTIAGERTTDQQGTSAPPSGARRLAAIVVPFGIAASPDLTILPVALAASAVNGLTVAGVLVVFAAVTMATFVGLTMLATLAGYQIKGEWLERNATTITALVLIAIGAIAYIGF